ncbi:MAG: TonB-dependent receptor plug domain-containing protein, partial [Schleiferiaceae bacterium]
MKNSPFWAGLALPFAVFGQVTDSNQIKLNEVSVTETKIIQKKAPSSALVHRIASHEIGRISASSTADLLTASGAAFMQKSQGGGGSPVLRGLEANKVLIVVDGVR